MSVLQNEALLETLWEEVVSEATDTGHISMMSESDIEFEVRRRFEDLQWNNLKIPRITLSEHPMEMKPHSVHMTLTLPYVKHPQTLNWSG